MPLAKRPVPLPLKTPYYAAKIDGALRLDLGVWRRKRDAIAHARGFARESAGVDATRVHVVHA
jgi:hypothetical protein